MKPQLPFLLLAVALLFPAHVHGQLTEQQLDRWLKRFPQADANGDGKLSIQEAEAYRAKIIPNNRSRGRNQGVKLNFAVDPGWDKDHFPDEAVCYREPSEIAELFGSVTSPPKPDDGSLRIAATGHSFMAPGFRTLPNIAKAGGFDQQTLLTHTGGGMTGSARYKWEQENGIFQFAGKPTPKLLASISNAKWDAMMWGPYFNDRPVYYSCWIDFCLKYNPDMKFYLSDAWPQLYQLGKTPTSEDELTTEAIAKMGEEKNQVYGELIQTLNKKYPRKVYVLPTNDAMVLAAAHYHRGELPGVEGIHKAVGKKERSLWRDPLGHLGPGFDRLEGYVFYATLYGRSPELIDDNVDFGGSSNFPSEKLDRVFRKIAWQATINHPLSGVQDKDKNGIDDKQD